MCKSQHTPIRNIFVHSSSCLARSAWREFQNMAQVINPQNSPWNPQPVIIGQQQLQHNSGNLKGSTPRVILGGFIIFLGVVAIALGIVSVTGYDYIGWGIWGGAVSIFVHPSIFAMCIEEFTYKPKKKERSDSLYISHVWSIIIFRLWKE